MDLTTGLGLLAGGLTTVSLIPQVTKIWKTKSAKDVSLKMFITFCVGVALWLTYGVLQTEIPIIVTNAVTLVLGLSILGMKLKYG